MLYKLIYITLYLCFFDISVESIEIIEVQTDLGKIKGKYVEDPITGACFYSFQGIPYAEPPVGKLRFKPPVRRQPCPTIIDATKPGYVCPQTEIAHSRNEMSEDCLNFNIYTPSNNNLTKYIPVIFYIHTGDYTYLSGNAKPIFGPELFMLSEVVLVTVNYRLGALGFMSLCNEEVSGNAGVKDVLLALKIIREIIWRFGGDGQKITLLGTGAGAAIAQLLMLTKESTGLFQNCILQGGSILSPEFIQQNPRENAYLLSEILDIDVSNDECMLDELRSVSPYDIIAAQEIISLNDPRRGFRNFNPFKPVVEIECENAIITRSPLELIRDGEICDVPILIGFNNQEGAELLPLLRREPQLIDQMNANFELAVPADITYPYRSVPCIQTAEKIREFYFNGCNISLTNAANYVDLISDIQYTRPIDFFVQLYTEKKKSPVYYFIFKGDTELNFFKAFADINYPGATHADGLGYIFLTEVTKPAYRCLGPVAKKVQQNIFLITKTFVYTGAPAPNANVKIFPQAGVNRYYVLGDYCVVPIYNRPLPERIAFWNAIYEEYYNSRYYTSTYFCSFDFNQYRLK